MLLAGRASTGRTWVSSPQLQEGDLQNVVYADALPPVAIVELWYCLASTSSLISVPLYLGTLGVIGEKCAFLRCSIIVLKLYLPQFP